MTEKKATGRPHNVPVRLSGKGFDWVEKQRKEFDVTRADVLRESLAVAAKHEAELRDRLRIIAVGF